MAVAQEPVQEEQQLNEFQDIPDEYIAEADQFHQACQSTPKFSRYYNCECLSVAYLDQRIQAGAERDQSSILLHMNKSACMDATEAAGYYFEQCLVSPNPFDADIGRDVYCGCFANALGDFYETGRFGTGSKDSVRIQAAAYQRCNDRHYLLELSDQ